MATKNTTVRLDKKMIEEVDQRCEDQFCTRNDYIKKAIDNQLETDASFKDEYNKNNQDQEIIEDTKSEPKPTIELIPEPKITIKEVSQDNSNKPVVQFTHFNGKLLPVAKRFNT